MDSNSTKSVRTQFNGQMLLKYTNVVKGWQYRWFTVDAQSGTLSYYLCDSSASSSSASMIGGMGSCDDSPPPNLIGNSPRWQEYLAGAVICPSDEDSRTFTVSCASGDTLKLRAANGRARQEWVDCLRNIAENSAQVLNVKHSFSRKRFSKKHFQSIGTQIEVPPSRESQLASDSFINAQQQLHQTELCNAALAHAIENAESPLSPNDPDLLLLKAISAASTHCLLQCLSLLQRHHDHSGDLRCRSHSEAAF